MDTHRLSLVEIAREHCMNPGLIHYIHGESHWDRTMALAGMIQAHHREADLGMVLCGACFHDIGRIDDGPDAEHGFRAARAALVAANLTAREMPELLPASRSEHDVWKGKLLEIIFHHCDYGPGTFLEMQIVKDADKLDRFRLSPQGPDPDRLALETSRNLMDTARKLARRE